MAKNTDPTSPTPPAVSAPAPPAASAPAATPRDQWDYTHLDRIYPDAESVFTFRLLPLAQIKNHAVVVFDANVLLVPYGVEAPALPQIRKAIETVTAQKRLMIPAQAAREFAKHRPAKIADACKRISGFISRVGEPDSLSSPILEPLPESAKVEEAREKLEIAVKEYRKAAGALLDRVKGWTWDDPVSQMYRELFVNGVVRELSGDEKSREALSKDFARRTECQVPPGYNDDRAGDLIIWSTILEMARERKCHVIFVTHDEKSDWRYQLEGKEKLYTRYELVDEFQRASDGKSIQVIRLSKFCELFGVDASGVEAVRIAETAANVMRNLIHLAAKKVVEADPMLSNPGGHGAIELRQAVVWAVNGIVGKTCISVDDDSAQWPSLEHPLITTTAKGEKVAFIHYMITNPSEPFDPAAFHRWIWIFREAIVQRVFLIFGAYLDQVLDAFRERHAITLATLHQSARLIYLTPNVQWDRLTLGAWEEG
jgi:hypothetical protein